MELGRYLGRRKSGYRRIDGSAQRRRRRSVVLLGNSSSNRRRRLWRVRPKIGILKLASTPKRFFVWLRDAYVKMMVGFADSTVVSAGYGGSALGKGIGKHRLKEYDDKMIVEIYKSILMGQGHVMVPRDAGKLCSRLSPVKE